MAFERGSSDAALEEALWEKICACQGRVFRTVKGLVFTYSIRGNEMFITRKDKSITRASVNIAYRTALEIQASGQDVDGPRQLKVFGASYLYPILVRLDIIHNRGEQIGLENMGEWTRDDFH